MRGGAKVGAIRDRCEDARRPNRSRVSHINLGRSEELQTPLPDKLSAGTVCFEVDGLTPTQTVERLKGRGIVASVTSPYEGE
jgi:hypothetical protein